MRSISAWTPEEILAYNLRDGGTAVTIFAYTQTYRVEKAKAFINSVIGHEGHQGLRIIELGCSAGDISGPFSEKNEVLGVDVVPAAVQLARERYPSMMVTEAKAEDVIPEDCDILVLTEFLEHIPDPLLLIADWLPKARFAVIGHPLNDPGVVEPGHVWSYEFSDYYKWLEIGGHKEIETHLFSGPFPNMVMGLSGRIG